MPIAVGLKYNTNNISNTSNQLVSEQYATVPRCGHSVEIVNKMNFVIKFLSSVTRFRNTLYL